MPATSRASKSDVLDCKSSLATASIITCLILLSLSLSFVFCVYNVGQTISLNDQQLTREVCHSSDLNSDYAVGDDFSIYDLNGEYNGGTYHVMFFDMSATW